MNTPVRVLHILQRMEAGGTQALLMNLYRNIDRSKVQFDFMVMYRSKEFYDDEIESMGGKIYRASVREDFNVFRFMRYLDDFFKNHKEYKIVHVHAYTIGWFCLRAAKKHGIEVRIAHSHNNETVHDIKWIPKMIMQKLYLLHATDLFACSDAAGKYLFRGESFTVLKNAIASRTFIHNEQFDKEVKTELGILPDTFVLGHVGRFHPQKNHSFLLEVFSEVKKKNPNSVLLLIGSGDLESAIQHRIEELGLKDSVMLLGNRSDMHRLYQAMDVFVLPSLFEGLGIVAIEAQAAGVPCVCSDTVAEDANVSPLFHRVGLKESAEVWAEKVLEADENPLKHSNTNKYIVDSGFDVLESTKKMEDYYIQKCSK